MRTTTIALAVCLALCAQTRAAKPYELFLSFDAKAADVYMSLRHPTYVDDTSNVFVDLDCGVLEPVPDWGVKGRTDDDPVFQDNPINGGCKIMADLLNDPGTCAVVVFAGSGSSTCTLNIVSWPGMPTQSITQVVSQGQPWYATNLPLAQNIGLHIQSVKQKLRGENWGWITIRSTFDTVGKLSVTSNFLRVSVRDENILHYDEQGEVRVNRKGTKARFGHPVRAILIHKKNNTLIMRGAAKMIYQSVKVPVFVAFNGWSGAETVPLDAKARYKAPKE